MQIEDNPTEDINVFHSIGESAASSDKLAELLSVMAYGYCIETGTYMGKGTRALAKRAVKVDTIDPCQECWQTRDSLPKNVKAHLCKGIDFTPEEPIDVLFIDSGLHSRGDDLEHFSSFMKPDGLIIIDDINLILAEELSKFTIVDSPLYNVIVLAPAML